MFFWNSEVDFKVRAITDPGHVGKLGEGELCTSLATRKVLQTCGLQCRGGHLAQTMLSLKIKHQFVCRLPKVCRNGWLYHKPVYLSICKEKQCI